MSSAEKRHPPIKNVAKKGTSFHCFKHLGASWDDPAKFKSCFRHTFHVLEYGGTYEKLKEATTNANWLYFLQLVQTMWETPKDILFPLTNEEEHFLKFAYLAHLGASDDEISTRKIQFELSLPIYEENPMAPEFVQAMNEIKQGARYWASATVSRHLATCIGVLIHSEPSRIEFEDVRQAIGCKVGQYFFEYLINRTDTWTRRKEKLPEEYQTDWTHFLWQIKVTPEDFELDKDFPEAGTRPDDQRAIMLEALKCSDELWTMASGEEAARTLVKEAISLGVGKEELLSHVESPEGRRFVEACLSDRCKAPDVSS